MNGDRCSIVDMKSGRKIFHLPNLSYFTSIVNSAKKEFRACYDDSKVISVDLDTYQLKVCLSDYQPSTFDELG